MCTLCEWFYSLNIVCGIHHYCSMYSNFFHFYCSVDSFVELHHDWLIHSPANLYLGHFQFRGYEHSCVSPSGPLSSILLELLGQRIGTL